MDEQEATRAWLMLLRAPGVGPGWLREWLAAADNDITGALTRARADHRINSAARAWLRAPDTALLDNDQTWVEEPGQRLVCCTDADFPPQLDAIAQPPAALFVVGRAELLLQPQLAIVGARGATPAGLANARCFARELAATGLVITSGLADGVDGAAHTGALDADGATVAIMGTGPDRTYPQRHTELAARIRETGLVVSEFVPGTGPRAAHFPRRNRLIAGLSLGVLVVEAGMRSGSLITARLAGQQGREVLVLPGSIHNPLARGCHRLIRDGAQLVETSEHIRTALAPLAQAQGSALATRLTTTSAAPAPAPGAADPDTAGLLQALPAGEPVAVDSISEHTGLSAPQVASMLLLLELEGKVASCAGGRWQKLP